MQPAGPFNVTLYANTTTIQTQELNLLGGRSTAITFEWNTTDILLGNYTIKAIASQVENETVLKNNEFSYSLIRVSIPGDINADRTVNIIDISKAARAFGSKLGEDRFEPNADMNEDRTINILDISAIAKEFGKEA
jgi:hypothetical protein